METCSRSYWLSRPMKQFKAVKESDSASPRRQSRGLARFLFLLAVAALLPLVMQAQETRPRRVIDAQTERPIRLTADLVTVIASVTDEAGNRVDDLTRGDFEVYEDNRAHDIESVRREDQMPLRLVFLFDTSTSIRHRFDFEQRAAARFFRQVIRPGDQAAIISVSTDPRLEVELVPDVDLLVGTLAALKPFGATSLYRALIDGARCLSPTDGRHVMVVLSDGTDTASAVTFAQALAEVQKADAVIYGVHSTGVIPAEGVQTLTGEFVLKAMSEDTGGRAFFPPVHRSPAKEAGELDRIYTQIAAEVRAQYVLTYYSKNAEPDGRFRSIRVQVRRPGLQVRARRGYYAVKG